MARFGLTQLPRRLAEHTGQTAPTYRRCFDYAVANRFPVEFANSRWTWDDVHLDEIAIALGMKPGPSIKPMRKSAAVAPVSAISTT